MCCGDVTAYTRSMMVSIRHSCGVFTVPETKSLTVKVPLDLHAKLVAFAERDMRSLHAEIIYYLREAVERREKGR